MIQVVQKKIKHRSKNKMMDFENFLKQIVTMDVSDIHLRVNEVPIVRKNGVMIKTNMSPLSKESLERIVDIVIPPNMKNSIDELLNYDFLYELPGVSRFRVNYAKSLQAPMLVFRVIPYKAPTFEERKIPKVLQYICGANNGVILVTGPTGSGKSTTLTAMLQYINNTTPKHIITIEDPIEFLHTNDKCIFSQRQVGIDTEGFPASIKAALRQDPYIILIGEIRDRETAREALSAAETGHLVFSTLHTSDAVQTVNRIVNFFEPYERDQIRTQLAQVLRATIAQKLIVTADNTGRVPAFEILVSTPTIKDYIMKDELENVYALIKEGKYSDMITLNMYLANLVREKTITPEVALQASENKNELMQIFKGTYHSTNDKQKFAR